MSMSISRAAKPSPSEDEVVLRESTLRSQRSLSMAVPLPSWHGNTGIENALDASSQSIAVSS